MSISLPKILIVEDEPNIVEILLYNLEREGFKCFSARDGQRGLQEAELRKPDLILLDLMLPGLDGLEVCRLLRQKAETKATPIIMLTAKGEESDKVLGLGIGADDYLTKPFSPKELIARIRAVLRRTQMKDVFEEKPQIEVGPLRIDVERHEVKVKESTVQMTAAEFRLLRTLAAKPGRVFTRDQLLERITGGESIVLDRNVDVHIGAIRRKLGQEGELIATVRGVGYKFRD